LGCKEKTFLQSWNWGEFQKMMGNKIWRLAAYNYGSRTPIIFSVALAVKITAKRGRFLLVPHGPNIISNFQFSISKRIPNPKSQILNTLLDKFKEIAKAENCSFIRIAPLLPGTEENKRLFKDLGFRESPMHASAYEATWKLDLTPPEKDLLMNMRKTTRYLIRQAERNSDIEIIKSNRLEDVEIFDRLNRKVAQHQKFVPFSFEFTKNEFDVFSKDGQALLFFGKYKGEIIAAALIIFWSGIGFYHQAALDPKYHKIPIAYLLQWEAIREAKKRNCRLYDFWGYVNPKQNPRHPWAGPTLFKTGFGGEAHEYVKTQDLPLSRRYWLIHIFERLRKAKRGL